MWCRPQTTHGRDRRYVKPIAPNQQIRHIAGDRMLPEQKTAKVWSCWSHDPLTNARGVMPCPPARLAGSHVPQNRAFVFLGELHVTIPTYRVVAVARRVKVPCRI